MNWFANLLKPLARGMAVLSPSCREATRLQSTALDRRLSIRERFGLRVHLLLCKWCRRYGKQITFLRSAAHEHTKDERILSPRGLSPEARERIRRRLETEESGRRTE